MSSLKKNFTYQIIYQILTIIMPLITSPYLSRVLGTQGLGEYSYSYSIAYYFSLFILLGVNNYGTREIAKVRENKEKRSDVFWSIYVIQLACGGIVSIIYILTQIFLRRNLLGFIQGLYVLSAILDINWLFMGLEKFKITVTRNLIIKVITVACIFIFVKDSGDTSIYTLIMSAGFFASQIVLWPFIKGVIVLKKININRVALHVKPLLILFIPVVAASLFKYMDKIMLGVMYSKSELGLYDNTEKIMSIPTSVITAVGMVMLPRISGLVEEADCKDKIMDYINLSMLGSIMVASALAFGIAAISDRFSIWFWGPEFSKCGNLIKMIAVTVLFLSWANVIRTQYLIPYGKDKIFVRAIIYGAIINFIINFCLIKEYGAIGTVIGTVIAEFVVAFYQTFKIRKDLPIRNYLKECFPFVIVGTIMYCVVYVISYLQLSNIIVLLLQMLCGASIYCGMIIVYLRYAKKISIKKIVEFARR